ncbi:F-UL4 protein [Chelonid alphaherpesvirus 5]|uniref:F-UL4 protein n=1 Tax=Chelonid alphaherpesvirus 5 TaxID=702736 RepID=V5NWP5_9ALPH|nr:F-UL4 protein [Chelonid alphaherpesvirus 5]AHA93322.1 F-UL4 protein [Chelonid alphaherpesvirus 5]
MADGRAGLTSVTYVLQTAEPALRSGAPGFEQLAGRFAESTRLVTLAGATERQSHRLVFGGRYQIQRSPSHLTVLIDGPEDFCFFKMDVRPNPNFSHGRTVLVDPFYFCSTTGREDECLMHAGGLAHVVLTSACVTVTVVYDGEPLNPFSDAERSVSDLLSEALLEADLQFSPEADYRRENASAGSPFPTAGAGYSM